MSPLFSAGWFARPATPGRSRVEAISHTRADLAIIVWAATAPSAFVGSPVDRRLRGLVPGGRACAVAVRRRCERSAGWGGWR
jgi:hypothetical protein